MRTILLLFEILKCLFKVLLTTLYPWNLNFAWRFTFYRSERTLEIYINRPDRFLYRKPNVDFFLQRNKQLSQRRVYPKSFQSFLKFGSSHFKLSFSWKHFLGLEVLMKCDKYTMKFIEIFIKNFLFFGLEKNIWI